MTLSESAGPATAPCEAGKNIAGIVIGTMAGVVHLSGGAYAISRSMNQSKTTLAVEQSKTTRSKNQQLTQEMSKQLPQRGRVFRKFISEKYVPYHLGPQCMKSVFFLDHFHTSRKPLEKQDGGSCEDCSNSTSPSPFPPREHCP